MTSPAGGSTGPGHLILALLAILVLLGCSTVRDDRPDIILVIIDTMRADHLGCYGYERSTSPAIDSLASSGVVFTRCQAQAPFTGPAHVSIWTGLSVESSGAGVRDGLSYSLDPALPNIATVLHDAGYVTLGMVNVSMLCHDYGFANGFDYYSWEGNGAGRAGETMDEFLRWMDENPGNPAPVFCLMHLYDVHAPYSPPSPFDSLFEPGGPAGLFDWVRDPATDSVLNPGDADRLVALYDGEIAWVDSQIGRLCRELRMRGRAGSTVIVITSDHGEHFLEHGASSHGTTLWQEVLHVPLVVCGAGVDSGLVDTLTAGQFDIMPTLCGLAGARVPEGLDGVDLFGPRDPMRMIPSSRVYKVLAKGEPVPASDLMVSVLVGSLVAIRDYSSDDPGTMYDLASDPGELVPLGVSPAMSESLDSYRTSPRIGHPRADDWGAISEQLRDLGYIR